jgi:ParB family transcriptional regulator, chromosome partitioning protein
VSKRGLPETVRLRHDLHYVEELFEAESGAIGRYLPIDQVQPNPDQPRRNFGDLSDLVASIREKGVLEPLLVRRHGAGYQIIAGERRWRACKELGLTSVPCIEKDVDDREVLELALIENLQRKDLTAFEEADGLQSLADRFGYTHAQIAQVIGKSRSSVTEVLSLTNMPAEIKALCRQADISSKSLLLQVVRQPGPEEMKQLVERIGRESLTREQVREHTAAEKKGKTKPFIFQSKGKDYKLMIRFRKSQVKPDEIRKILEKTLDDL